MFSITHSKPLLSCEWAKIQPVWSNISTLETPKLKEYDFIFFSASRSSRLALSTQSQCTPFNKL